MESDIVDIVNRDDNNLFLVTDAVLTLIERGFLRRSVLQGDTINLCISLPAIVFIEALKDSNVCVDVEEVSAAAGAIKRGTGDSVPVTSSTRMKKFFHKIFPYTLKKIEI